MSSRVELVARAKDAIANAETARFEPVLLLEILLEMLNALDATYEILSKYQPVTYETPAEAYTRGAENEATHIFDRIAEQAEAHDVQGE